MMIKASEARDKYNSSKKAAEKFIHEFIEPEILKVAEDETHITVKGVDAWYQGSSYSFPRGKEPYDATYGCNVPLTGIINGMLASNGYKVSCKTTRAGNEYQEGEVIFTIEWRGSNGD